MSSGTGWLKMFLTWCLVLLIFGSGAIGHEAPAEVPAETFLVPQEQDQAEDRAVGGRPGFDPSYSVPNSHGMQRRFKCEFTVT